KFCKDCNIVQFKDALIKAGYTDPKIFLSKTEDELDNIGKAAGMKFMYLRKFKNVVLEQQKSEFESYSFFFYPHVIIQQWCQNNGFGKFSQELMKRGIKNNRELMSKSDSELDELCKRCSIRLGFAHAFQTAVRALQEKNEDKKEEKETKVDVTMDIESTITNEDEETSSINVNISEEELQAEKLELKVETTLKGIGVRLSKIQGSRRKHYRPRFENTLENLSNGKYEEHFQKLKDTLGAMKTQGYVTKNDSFFFELKFTKFAIFNKSILEEFEIECIFLGLCGFEVKEVVVEKDEETKKEEQKKTFDICGSVNKDAVVLMAQKLYLVEQTLAMVIENKNNTNESQVNDTFINQFEHMLRIMKVDLLMLADKQKRGRIYNHASGFYDDQFIVFTLQQFISEVQDSTLAFKPVLNSDYLEKFVNFIGGKSTISTENASKINMDDLKHLKIHPVGLFGTKEEVIWQLQTFNCISKPIQDMLSSEKSEECLSMGLYAI
ncbi:hypothetical protein RFI_30124, partial [Reticulomyxa filosa]